jgi:hypothetical protein
MASPDVSIIMETDNLRSVDKSRTVRAMSALAEQLSGTGRSVEVLVSYDPEVIDPTEVKGACEESGLAQAVGDSLFVNSDPGLLYYEVKNRNARRARGELILMLDSDSIPEPGWFAALVAAFDDPSVQIACGNTYTQFDETLFDRSHALFWNFELRMPDGPATPDTRIYANNFGARREFLLAHPFPIDDRYRGQCATLVASLVAGGETSWKVPTARVEHPSPQGFMARRALWRGHDRLLTRRDTGSGAGFGFMLRVLASDMKASLRRTLGGRSAVGLRNSEIPAALGIATAYNVLSWLGMVVTAIRPRLLARFLPL